MALFRQSYISKCRRWLNCVHFRWEFILCKEKNIIPELKNIHRVPRNWCVKYSNSILQNLVASSRLGLHPDFCHLTQKKILQGSFSFCTVVQTVTNVSSLITVVVMLANLSLIAFQSASLDEASAAMACNTSKTYEENIYTSTFDIFKT